MSATAKANTMKVINTKPEVSKPPTIRIWMDGTGRWRITDPQYRGGWRYATGSEIVLHRPGIEAKWSAAGAGHHG